MNIKDKLVQKQKFKNIKENVLLYSAETEAGRAYVISLYNRKICLIVLIQNYFQIYV